MNILIGWELGAGNGHYYNVKPIAEAFLSQGHNVRIYGNGLHNIQDIDPNIRTGIVSEIPIDQRVSYQRDTALNNIADLYYVFGFHNPTYIERSLDSWETVFYDFNPDVVISEYAFFLNLHAYINNIPVVNVGTSFTLPPLVDNESGYVNFPGITQPSETVDISLGNINQVLAKKGISPLDSIVRLHEGNRFVMTLPVLDIYAKDRTSSDYVLPLDVNRIGGEFGEKLFVYVNGNIIFFPQWPKLKKLLMKLGDEVIFYGKGLSVEDKKQLMEKKVEVLSALQSFENIKKNCRAIVHHSGHGVCLNALLAGLPQFMLPLNFEQELNAQKIVDCKSGTLLNLDDVSGVSKERLIKYFSSYEIIDSTKKYSFAGKPSAVDCIVDRALSLAGAA